MLIEFTLENYRSFRDKSTFSMVASSDKSHPQNTFDVPTLGKERLLRAAVIYGANAAGKSALFDALQFFWQFAGNSDLREVDAPIPIQPFLLDEHSKSRPSMFELSFVGEDEVRYQYGFIADSRQVYEEWLYAYPKRLAQHLFGREWIAEEKAYRWHFGPNFRDKRAHLEMRTRQNALLLSVGARYNHAQCTAALRGINPGIIPHNSEGSSQELFQEISSNLATGNEFVSEAMTQMLRQADLGINSFTIEKARRFKDEEIPPGLSDEYHNILASESRNVIQLGHNTNNGDKVVFFPFDAESRGTRRLFGLSGLLWVSRSSRSTTIVIDELDESLHPSLVRWLLEFFQNVDKPDQRKAQLIFNTHDTTLLDLSLLRRDQIWFVEKDGSGVSHLYPLSDYSPRRDEALAKGYLRGRYGAIPFLQPLASQGTLNTSEKGAAIDVDEVLDAEN